MRAVWCSVFLSTGEWNISVYFLLTRWKLCVYLFWPRESLPLKDHPVTTIFLSCTLRHVYNSIDSLSHSVLVNNVTMCETLIETVINYNICLFSSQYRIPYASPSLQDTHIYEYYEVLFLFFISTLVFHAYYPWKAIFCMVCAPSRYLYCRKSDSKTG